MTTPARCREHPFRLLAVCRVPLKARKPCSAPSRHRLTPYPARSDDPGAYSRFLIASMKVNLL